MERVTNYPEAFDESAQQSSRDEISDTFPKEIYETYPRYRNIPVRRIPESLNLTPARRENVSGMREIQRTHNASPKSSNGAPQRTVQSSGQKSAGEPDVALIQKQTHFSGERHRAEKALQNSLSEPMLETKDRGDIAREMEYEEDASDLSNTECGNFSTSQGGLKGYVLLKSGGKIYRSFISAGEVMPKKSWDSHWKGFASKTCGDFDVAIFLTGLEKPDPPGTRSSSRDARTRMDSSSKTRATKLYKPRYEVKQTTVRPCLGKNLESSHDRFFKLKPSFSGGYPGKEHHRLKKPSFIFSPDRLDFYRMLSDQQMKDAESAISSASESESMHRTPRNLIRSKLLQEPIVINDRILPRDRFSTKRHDTYSKSSDASQTSLMFREMAQAKIGDVELFAIFESIFRRYSSTSRHTGDVISKSISTDWMVNAGVVGNFLTRKEADETFKKAAGARITMNSKEYKEFLIKLTQRLKLPYYEIYHRMCGFEG